MDPASGNGAKEIKIFKSDRGYYKLIGTCTTGINGLWYSGKLQKPKGKYGHF